MKLLGRLSRGPKRNDKANDHNSSHTNQNEISSSPSPFRFKSSKVKSRALPPVHAQFESNSSIMSIPTSGYDDHTISANTLYEWSVADNVPSINSAAELFTSEEHLYAGRSAPVNKLDKGHGGYGSSSDEDDDDDQDDMDENIQNLQYCKLSDSPPHNHFDDVTKCQEEETAVRKGKGLFNRSKNSINTRNEDSYKTPSSTPDRTRFGYKLKTRHQQNKRHSKELPVQSLRKSDSSMSGPVDVDSFLGEGEVEVSFTNSKTNTVDQHPQFNPKIINKKPSNGKAAAKVASKENCLPPDLKGRIHAVNFDDEDDNALNSSLESNITTSSVQNVGNANSPFHEKPTPAISSDTAAFSSMRNLGDSNSPEMYYKDISEMEPSFTFSISEEDLDGNHVDSFATAWLLNDDDGNASRGKNTTEKKKWELEKLQTDLLRDRNATSEGVSCGSRLTHNGNGGSGTNGKRFRKIKKFLNHKKNHKTDSVSDEDGNKGIKLVSSRIDKGKLKRDQSGLSMAPLTGIEQHTRLGRLRKDKELNKEVERRKEIERRDIERQQNEKQKKIEQTQRLREAERWMVSDSIEKNMCSTNAVCEPIDSRKKLQEWIMGEKNVNVNTSQQQEYESNERTFQNNLSTAYDEGHSKVSRSAYTLSTARIDNTTKVSQMQNRGPFDFEPQFPDEDSTAQTPEACAPTTHDFSCVICSSGERTHLAVPCMHFSFCGECCIKLSKSGKMRCAVCNEEVTQFSKVFY